MTCSYGVVQGRYVPFPVSPGGWMAVLSMRPSRSLQTLERLSCSHMLHGKRGPARAKNGQAHHDLSRRLQPANMAALLVN